MALTKIDDRGLKTPIDLLDNEKIRFGTGNDLEIYHSGTSSYIQDNGTGDLIIRASDQLKIQDTDNGESMAIFNKDGAVELYHNNSLRFQTDSNGCTVLDTRLQFNDNTKAQFGTGGDFQIFHNGSHSFVTDRGTGHLYIRGGDDVRIEKYVDDSNGEPMIVANVDGSVDLYYDNVKKFETTSNGAKIEGHLYLDDDKEIRLGDSGDFQFYHNNTSGESRIYNSNAAGILVSSDLVTFKNKNSNETLLTATNNGSVDLYYDNSKKFETTSGGVQVNGDFKILNGGDDVFFDASENWMRWDDNVKIQCGNSGDLNIYHDGSNSFIENTTGNIYIQNDSSSTSEEILIRPKAGEQSARFIANGAVELYWNNVKTLETNSEGITVQGNEGSAGAIYLYADEGDDNADKWLLQAKSDSSAFAIQNNKSGAWDNSLKCYGDGAVDLYYDNELRLSTTTTGTYFNEKQLVTGGTCKFRTYGGAISVSNNSYHDCQLSSNFGNDSAIRIEYSYNWNDGDGGAWGSAVVWNEHDSANTRSRFLGEEISGPGSSVEFVTSGSNVYFRFNSSGMNGTFIIAAYATQCDLY